MKKTSYTLKRIYGVFIMAETLEEVSKIQAALKFFKKQDPLRFKWFQNIDSVLVRPVKGYDNMLFPTEAVYVCQRGTVLESSISYLAGLFVHESRHMWQYMHKKPYLGASAEKDAYTHQRKFLKKIKDESSVEWLDYLYNENPWWKFNKSTGEKTLVSPKNDLLWKFAKNYLDNKLNIREG